MYEYKKGAIHQDGVNCGMGEFVCEFCLVAQVKALGDADVANSNRISNLLAEIRDKQDTLDKAAGWLRETREGWSASDYEFAEYYGELGEILDVEFTEEVNITITIEVSATITKPIGADVHYHDFDIDSLDISTNESNWEIDLGDPEITDVN